MTTVSQSGPTPESERDSYARALEDFEASRINLVMRDLEESRVTLNLNREEFRAMVDLALQALESMVQPSVMKPKYYEARPKDDRPTR